MLILVSVFMLVAVVMFAAVVDLGSQRSEKKVTTLSTDAAALAAVSVIDFGDGDAVGSGISCADVDSTDKMFGSSTTVQDIANHYLSLNDQSSTPLCEIFFDSSTPETAYVTVSTVEPVDYQVASGLGHQGGRVTGSSSARVSAGDGGGLYPVGICADAADFAGQSIEALLGGEAMKSFSPPEALGLIFENNNHTACGGAGNFSQIDFSVSESPGQCQHKGQFCFDLIAGFPDRPLPFAEVSSNPGSDWGSNKIEPKGEALVGKRIWLPAFTDGVGNGNPATYPMEYFVEVEVTAYETQANPKYMTFDVYRIIPFTLAGPPLTSDINPVPAHLCATGEGTNACATGAHTPAGPQPCSVTPIDPQTRNVTVDGGGVPVDPVQVTVTVAQVSDCDNLRLRAVGGTTPVLAADRTIAGNTYTFTFRNDMPLAPAGNTRTLEVFDANNVVWDQSASISTVGTSPMPCTAAMTVATKPNVFNTQGANKNLEVSANLSGETCSDLEFRLIREGEPEEPFDVGGPYSTPAMNATVLKSDSVWRDGWFRIEVWSGTTRLTSDRFQLT